MRIFLLYIFFQFVQLIGYSQTGDKVSLQKEKENLKGELAALQREYVNVMNGKEKSLASLRVIQDKIEVRNKLIVNINSEVELLDKDLTKTQRQVNSLNSKLDTLRAQYGRSIVYAYKNRNNYDFLTFIFSANNFNDALKRIQYLKEYRNYRARQAEDIRKYKDFLLGKKHELDGQKKEKSSVLQNQSSELNELAGEQNDLSNSVVQLTSNENSIGKLIAQQKMRQQKVLSQIIAINKREEIVRRKALEAERKRIRELAQAREREQAIARAEAAKAAKEAKLEAARNAAANSNAKINRTGSSKSTGVPKSLPSSKPVAINIPKPPPPPHVERIPEEPMYTPTEMNANASFEANKGRMNYPLQGGYIRTRFGLQNLGSVQWNNESTTFESSSPGATVVAIFNGVVKSVDNDEDTKTIFISHGKYISVYANLSNVSVSVGQAVTAGQAIGRCAASEEQAGKGLLELMMFRDNKIENPERWIRR